MGTNYNLEQPAVSSSPAATPVNASASEEKSKSSYGLLIVAIIFLIAVVGVLLYLLYSSAQKAGDADDTPTSAIVLAPTATPDPRYDGWQTYSKTTSIQSYSFRYPADWTLTEDTTSETDIEVVVASPDLPNYAFQVIFASGYGDVSSCIFPDTDTAQIDIAKQDPNGYFEITEFVEIKQGDTLVARRGFNTHLTEPVVDSAFVLCNVDPETKYGHNVWFPYSYVVPSDSVELEEEILQTLDLMMLSFKEDRVR